VLWEIGAELAGTLPATTPARGEGQAARTWLVICARAVVARCVHQVVSVAWPGLVGEELARPQAFRHRPSLQDRQTPGRANLSWRGTSPLSPGKLWRLVRSIWRFPPVSVMGARSPTRLIVVTLALLIIAKTT
jgi:hypothetical protein